MLDESEKRTREIRRYRPGTTRCVSMHPAYKSSGVLRERLRERINTTACRFPVDMSAHIAAAESKFGGTARVNARDVKRSKCAFSNFRLPHLRVRFSRPSSQRINLSLGFP